MDTGQACRPYSHSKKLIVNETKYLREQNTLDYITCVVKHLIK